MSVEVTALSVLLLLLLFCSDASVTAFYVSGIFLALFTSSVSDTFSVSATLSVTDLVALLSFFSVLMFFADNADAVISAVNAKTATAFPVFY